ncbi:putative wall-associated receptor kinase-like 16 isoform X3 [Magnolia sinica]|uniref:putative wall-associated receptor kinase-like 16 isoform X3 n=1 Tax=Magnolia sinica TaxID=86752 RepID=UPI00265AE1FD|nr:putative wall-associated receptor kinase-like 16 isoform X3 [Magnolia sinica]
MGLYLLLQLFCLATTLDAIASQPLVKPGCPDKCGDVSIPYPFGIGDSCNIGVGGFNITCNNILPNPKPFWGDFEVLEISLPSGLMRIPNDISYQCYNNAGVLLNHSTTSLSLYEDYSFTFSETRNRFIAIGCDTVGLITDQITGQWGSDFTRGCVSICRRPDNMTDSSCSGAGCCQTEIPKGLKRFAVEFTSFNRHRNVSSFNPCSFAFLGEEDVFRFKPLDLEDTKLLERSRSIPVVIDWVIGNEGCEIARKNSSTFACVSENSDCYNSITGMGYLCNCSKGYEGNPYLTGGCQDINECEEDHQKTLCQHDCINLPGNYSCSCPKGYHGLHDDKRECIKDTNEFPVDHVVLGIGLSLLFLLIGSPSLYWVWRKRKLIKLKEKFFQQNGGLLLQEKISSCQSSTEPCKIYTTEELEKATKNYDKNQIVGQGGYGTVYKGILPDKRIVAVKKSKIGDESQIEQFINEIHILSQINHRNIVKLVGCCLEAEVPILVYEFISNGTLSQHIHDEGRVSSISLENRLRIAAETAGALYYLHSAASTPIFHRDVKSANILLDDNFTAKVSDFGASRLVPLDHTRITTLVMGTWGYLDPEYHQTGQLTGKSDVYSFGVVLVELLTGEGPVSSTRSQVNRSLSSYFLSSMKENRIFEILAEQVQEEGTEEQLIAVARLAERCLKLKGEERPTMKEVVVELEGLRRIHEHPREPKNREETENLLGETGASQGYTGNVSNGYSVDGHTLSALEIGR